MSPVEMWTSILVGIAFFFAAAVVWLWTGQDPHRRREPTTRDVLAQLRRDNQARITHIEGSLTVLRDVWREQHPAASVPPLEPGIEVEKTVRTPLEQPPHNGARAALRRTGRHWRRSR